MKYPHKTFVWLCQTILDICYITFGLQNTSYRGAIKRDMWKMLGVCPSMRGPYTSISRIFSRKVIFVHIFTIFWIFSSSFSWWSTPPPLPIYVVRVSLHFVQGGRLYFGILGLQKTERLIGTKSQFFHRSRLMAPLLALYPQFWGVQHVIAIIFPKSCFPESVDLGI